MQAVKQVFQPCCTRPKFTQSRKEITHAVVPEYKFLLTGVLEVGSKLQGHPVMPLHIVYPWLQLLLWLADARWRKLDAAAPVEQLQQFLDVLQGHVAMLWVAHPNEDHEQTGAAARNACCPSMLFTRH